MVYHTARELLFLAAALPAAHAFYVPFYGTTANGFPSSPRGWNSFGLQSGSDTLKHNAGWDFNDYHFRQQCDLLQTQGGRDYVCSIDSGWSEDCNGDANGIFSPKSAVIPNITDLAAHLHSRGLKFGLYILPGAFSGDASKVVQGTGISIGSLFASGQPEYNCRKIFDFSKDGVQQFHNSVVQRFASWGVDFIKLDYMTPGSPQAGESLPTNTSGSAIAYHKAIQSLGVKMRLDISWKLDRSDPYWGIWQSSADSLRVDQDINNSGQDTFVAWQMVLRTLDYYRQFINEQTVASRQGKAIQIRPDMDNTYIGDKASTSGISDVQRYTMAISWLGAGANYITGSDLTTSDTLGKELLFNAEALSAGDFTANYPMQPRNPSGSKTVGGNAASQLQAWIAGPNAGQAVVVLSNYGPDPCLSSSSGCNPTYGTSLSGVRSVNITLNDLGIGGKSWSVRRVWGGGGSGGADHSDLGITSTMMGSNLGPGESALYVLTQQ